MRAAIRDKLLVAFTLDPCRVAAMTRYAFSLGCLLALLLGSIAPPKAGAAELASDWGATKQGRVRLLAAPGADGAVRLGLQFQLQPGWKIYWRAPGDAGLPPEIDWAQPGNLTIGEISWPVPDRFSYAGLETFGYEGEVVFPIAATRPDLSAPVSMKPIVHFLTCAQICVPNDVTLRFDLPADAAASPESAALIDRFAARVPGPPASAGLELRSAGIAESGKDAVLSLRLAARPGLQHPDVMVEGADGFSFLAPSLEHGDELTRLVIQMPGGAGASAKLGGRTLRVTIVDRASPTETPRAAYFAAVPVVPAMPDSGLAALLPILALAILGGFILNFMPCVLPVLSIKLLALIEHSGQERRAARLGFLASAAGIIVSFLVMAGVLVAMRSAGLAVGWGFQFQEPAFLAVLAAIVTLFACNLLGWLEISLPWWLAGMAPGGGPSLGGNFLTGAFATVLATPCSAPFLGTAIGFALAGSAADIFLIFLFLGIGLALPYFVVAAFPGVAGLLPRPGRWMLLLRRILGLLLVATAIWLVGVLTFEAGTVAAVSVGVLAVAASACLAMQSRLSEGWSRRGAGGIAAVLLLAMIAPPLVTRPEAMPLASAEGGWVPFDETAIAGAVAAGKTVFVDVTASWCLTCQVNERLVLDSESVRQILGAPPVVAMRADWTRRDAKIGDYLKTYGRYGIPFNVVYGPGAPGGVALPELLTNSIVLEALRRASGQSS
jgi:suppressor for copper-sensitivity B